MKIDSNPGRSGSDPTAGATSARPMPSASGATAGKEVIRIPSGDSLTIRNAHRNHVADSRPPVATSDEIRPHESPQRSRVPSRDASRVAGRSSDSQPRHEFTAMFDALMGVRQLMERADDSAVSTAAVDVSA